MIATTSPCQACGWEFYGFGYAGEPCSAECDELLREKPQHQSTNPDRSDGGIRAGGSQ